MKGYCFLFAETPIGASVIPKRLTAVCFPMHRIADDDGVISTGMNRVNFALNECKDSL